MKKIKIGFFFLLFLLGAFALYVMSLDSSFKVTRSRTINAPANLIFNQIGDLKNWEKWSPWKEKDTSMVFEFSKNANQEGGYFHFKDEHGNYSKLTNITLKPDSLIIQTLTTQDQTQELKWQLLPADEGVKLVWTVSGELPLQQRIFSGQMEDMIGPMMTRGLERIDHAVHKDMEKRETKIDKLVDLGSNYYLYESASCKLEDLGKKMDSLLPDVLIYVIRNKIKMNGKPFTIYEKYDTENNSVIFSTCIPTHEKIEAKNPNILTGKMPGGKYLRSIFTGDYKFLREGWKISYDSLKQMKAIQIDSARSPFEVYTKGHTMSLNPADWETEIYIPVKVVEDKENKDKNKINE
jgi:DNA gyrase inhibitor GyrI/uncharacterized protein YndB with AHSA1/START domain